MKNYLVQKYDEYTGEVTKYGSWAKEHQALAVAKEQLQYVDYCEHVEIIVYDGGKVVDEYEVEE